MRLAKESGAPVTFIASAEPRDAEMAERIDRHRAQRPPGWTTLEAPVDLYSAVMSAGQGDYLVIDCLTLWVSNLLGNGRTSSEVLIAARRLAEVLRQRRAVVVSNEVGLGIMPDNELARIFEVALGNVNAVFAECAERSVFMVAGRALELKSF